MQNKILKNVENENKIEKLVSFLKFINLGDMNKYLEIENELNDFFDNEIMLKNNRNQIKSKAHLISLMEMVFKKVSQNKTFTFKEISEATKVEINKVEFLVMKAFSLGLLKGFITQTEETCTFTWVLPRVLDQVQLSYLNDKLDDWLSMTKKTVELFEAYTEN